MGDLNIFNLTTFLGGLALFIYGMTLMGSGLEKVAGNKLQKIVEQLTSNIFKGVFVGAIVTGAIQSSAATTVMVVGFVNAGIMTLKQAVGVIMGANIGTTVTALLISLNMVQGDNIFLMLLKPANLAPLAIAVGVFMVMICKKPIRKKVGEICVGFGILFTGIVTMEASASVLREMPAVLEAFRALSNPVIGILVGCLVTAIIQSSSASVGILQAISQTGVLTFSAAAPIILGQNIGTCVTALISSVGANKNAKKAAFVHLYFNVIGTIIFITGIYLWQYLWGFPFWDTAVNSLSIAKFHIFFNIGNTMLLLPFSNLLVKLANATCERFGGKQEDQLEVTALDDRFLKTPAIAMGQAQKAAIDMGKLCLDSFHFGQKAVVDGDLTAVNKILEYERAIDKLEYRINQYLQKVNQQSLTDDERKLSSMLLQSIGDFERLGDHAENLSEIAEHMREDTGVRFTPHAREELQQMMGAVDEILHITITSFENGDANLARRVEPLEEVIDMFRDTLKARHIERLTDNECTVDAGVHFLEIINNLERIADHCSNIGFYVIQMNQKEEKLDSHDYLKKLHSGEDTDFSAYFQFYKEKYYQKIMAAQD